MNEWTTRVCPEFFIGAETEGPKAVSWRRVLGEGQQPSLYQLVGLGKRCELPSGVRGRVPTAQMSSTMVSTQDVLS